MYMCVYTHTHTHTHTYMNQASLVDRTVKNLPSTRETPVQSLGWEDALEKRMAIDASIFTWKIPWTEEPRGYSPWVAKSQMTE